MDSLLHVLQMLDKIGERRQPWRTSSEVWKKSPLVLFWRTALLYSSYSALLKLKFFMTCHRPSCHTRSNAFLKSMELWQRTRWCRRWVSISSLMLKICSTLLLFGRNPASSSAKIPPAFPLIRFKRTHSTTLVG